MDSLLKDYIADVDLLLTEVCMTAAMHGLDSAVSGIAAHLRDLSDKEGAAVLSQSLGKIAIRDYDSALAYADEVLGNASMVALHPQAAAFRKLAEQLARGEPVEPLNVSG